MATPPPPPAQQHPCPLYDLFLDLPHPAASKACPGPFLIPSPVKTPVADEINSILPQIARFSFPEYDETAAPPPQPAQPPSSDGTHPPQPPLLNHHDVYAMQTPSFSQFTFSLQLQTGARLHGHVRRYMPPHLVARSRYDVGRRGERALVLLTRATGADLLYTAMLKSVEAISSQQAALSPEKMPHRGNPQQWFLHQLSRYHQHLSQIYASQPATEKGKPLMAAIPGIELGAEPEMQKFKTVDVNKYIMPVSILHSSNNNPDPSVQHPSQQQPIQGAAGSLLPLLRCVGVAHALRIASALLSERRVILVSASPTRLALCSQASISMLATGLLHWQHLYIPVLPPHLWQYLAAPYPYLIGILQSTVPRLERTDGLEEVLIIHLDTNTMETRGMEASQVAQRVPDLFQTASSEQYSVGSGQNPNMAGGPGGGVSTASEVLAQDLFEILKQDKKVLYGDSAVAKVGETAAKATKAVKKTFFKLRDKGRQYLQQRANERDEYTPGEVPETEEVVEEGNTMASDYIYTEGSHNEFAEQEARVAFTAFFLSMLGDMRWYLTTPANAALPVLDRKKFLQNKRALGDGEGTPMWALLNNFCQTQMLEEFAKSRIQEVSTRLPVTVDTPLFLRCAAFCRQHQVDFNLVNAQRVTRQVVESSPSNVTSELQTNARRNAMMLTSNKAFEADNSRAIAQLVSQCREATSILSDVMSVIWLRLRDCKGMQWKHAYQALQILRNLLYHGPIAAISEATDGLSKIRALKFYDNMRAQCVQQVRGAAAIVYNLLVDRSKLFQIRRVCTERRRLMQSKTEPKLIREPNTRFGIPFRNIHAMMHPNASRGTVVQIPPKAQAMERGNGQSAPNPAIDIFAASSGQAPVQSNADQAGDAARDLVGLFDNVAVSSSTSPSTTSAANPFDSFATPAPTPASLATQAQPPQNGVPSFAQAPQQPVASPPLHQIDVVPRQTVPSNVTILPRPTEPNAQQPPHQQAGSLQPQQHLHQQPQNHSQQTQQQQQPPQMNPQQAQFGTEFGAPQQTQGNFHGMQQMPLQQGLQQQQSHPQQVQQGGYPQPPQQGMAPTGGFNPQPGNQPFMNQMHQQPHLPPQQQMQQQQFPGQPPPQGPPRKNSAQFDPFAK